MVSWAITRENAFGGNRQNRAARKTKTVKALIEVFLILSKLIPGPFLIIMGKPPALPGDSQSLTFPGVYESLLAVNCSKLTGKETLDVQR
jgi:hypothetical protein